MYQLAIKIPDGDKRHQPFPFQGLPKYYKNVIFGMQIYHLATLV
jgi:hypothetical protein